MSGVAGRRSSGLWALDAALLLLGMLVVLMVLRVLRFDNPNPLLNAWTYLLGIPTAMIAISMLTRVLASEAVEKSIQLGFLFSVGLHLMLIVFAFNFVLFSNSWPSNAKEVALVMTSPQTKTTQFFSPTDSKSEDRPDYLKPVQTSQNNAHGELDSKQSDGKSAELKLELEIEQTKPSLADKPFNKPRKEATPSQPTITSTAERLNRPDVSSPIEPPKTEIDIPNVEPSRPLPSQEMQAEDAEAQRSDINTRDRLLNAALDAKLNIESGPIAGSQQGLRNRAPISNPSESDFLSDPRFAMSNAGERKLPVREAMRAGAAPLSGQPIPTDRLETPSPPVGDDVSSQLADAMAAKSDIGKPNSAKQAIHAPKQPFESGLSSSLSPTVGGPSLELGQDRWAAPLMAPPRKGPDLVKRDIAMPEIRDVDLTIDRFKRPETGGPKIANSTVPIPAPAFSQRLNRNRDQVRDSAAEVGPLGPQTEAAIERGLQFLAKYQRPDGSWHLEDFGERVDIRSDTAATALALLSFQGAGYTHQQFKYESVCGSALKWLVENQRPSGDLYVPTDAKSDANAWLYSHAIATLALCESYGMTQDPAIREHAQKAIDFLVQSQDPQAGGWRYQPKIGSDTSVTGWCMMALKSAELSGLRVPKESYEGIAKWLKGSQASEQQRYLYRYNWQAADTAATRHGKVPTPVMTSVGLLMQLYLGWRRDNPDMLRGTQWLLERLPSEGTVSNPQRDTYYWYYATQVLFHMGGESWKSWYQRLYPLLIRSQKLDGEFAGSWEPNGRIPDAWGRFGGRLYVTTLNLLSLEVYYRHLPIYDATAD